LEIFLFPPRDVALRFSSLLARGNDSTAEQPSLERYFLKKLCNGAILQHEKEDSGKKQ
jgi:hypothetical protein